MQEPDEIIGLYPFEPLHDMRKALMGLGPANPDPAARRSARQAIDQAWDALRPNFLDEFDPPEPSRPITIFGARDDRRQVASN